MIPIKPAGFVGFLHHVFEMPCYGNDVLKQEYQGMLNCGRQKTFKGSSEFMQQDKLKLM